MTHPTHIGIDVAKHWLDVHLHPEGLALHLPNTPTGIAALLEYLRLRTVARVVLEATGGLEHASASALHRAGYAVAVVNPARTSAFRRARGLLAKTDAVDAELLALYAARMEPQAGGVLTPEHKRLKELAARRRQLLGLLGQERNRLKQMSEPLVLASIKASIERLTAERQAVEGALLTAIRSDEVQRQRYELVTSIPCLGPVAAMTLLTELPELGSLNRKEIASLAGLAPHANESGLKVGNRHIRGGRGCVRHVLYMTAVVAVRRHPQLKPMYQRMRADGKPAKVALVTLMRKLLVTANAVVKTGSPWQKGYGHALTD